jgi:hypothetical protein
MPIVHIIWICAAYADREAATIAAYLTALARQQHQRAPKRARGQLHDRVSMRECRDSYIRYCRSAPLVLHSCIDTLVRYYLKVVLVYLLDYNLFFGTKIRKSRSA